MAKRITIQFIGSLIDNQDVRLADFLQRLETVKRALKEAERMFAGTDTPALDYKIVDLRHSSPSTVVIEPIPTLSAPLLPPHYADRVVRGFSTELRLIKKKGRILRSPDIDRLRAYQELGGDQDSLVTSLRIDVDHRDVIVDDDFRRRVTSIIGPDELLQGTVSGMLEALNFHNTNKFTIFPDLGPKRVSGFFPIELRPKVKEAIGNYVTVVGTLKYKVWSPFPHEVIAKEIRVHPPDSELPTLSEMRGAFPNLTGGMRSVDFIDRIRDENW